MIVRYYIKAGGRAVDLGGPSVYQGGAESKLKHKSRCLPKSELVDWVGQACQLEGPGFPWRQPCITFLHKNVAN